MPRTRLSGSAETSSSADVVSIASRYAGVVPIARATAASAVPAAMETLVTTRSRARTSTRSRPVNDSAIMVASAVRCMACCPTAAHATITKADGVRTTR